MLDITEQEAKVRLNLSFEVRLRFANGVRVKDPAIQSLRRAGSSGWQSIAVSDHLILATGIRECRLSSRFAGRVRRAIS